jgi:hypothetical protein
LNLRPSGYEPDELPGCSTPRRSGLWAVSSGRGRWTGGAAPCQRVWRASGFGGPAGLAGRRVWRAGGFGGVWGFGEPGGDLLFRRLSGSTIGAEGFHGRVRDGIGCCSPRCGHQAGQTPGWLLAEPAPAQAGGHQAGQAPGQVPRPRPRRAVVAGRAGFGPAGLGRAGFANVPRGSVLGVKIFAIGEILGACLGAWAGSGRAPPVGDRVGACRCTRAVFRCSFAKASSLSRKHRDRAGSSD